MQRRRSRLAALFAVALALSLDACAANNYRHTLARHGAIDHALIALQNAELQDFASHAYDEARHQRYQTVIKRLVAERSKLDDALSGWEAGRPTPPVVAQAVNDLHEIMLDAATLSPPPALLLSSAEQAVGLLTINAR